jgi:hypothetical protein
MICYMPFIDIEYQLLNKLTAALGPVTIYCPSAGMVSENMLAAVREERLDLRSGQGVDPEHLDRALQEFRAWADLHGGDIADLAGLSKTMQGLSSLIDETRPTSIGDQIRHFGEQNPQVSADPVFQASLFLSMARQFDRQQVAVSRDLGDVQTMERAMLARLAGDARGLEEGIDAASDADVDAGMPDTGGFMTARRVRSWAELACSDTGPRSFILYVTSSPAVLEHVLDHFDQARGPLRARLETGDSGGGRGNRSVIEALENLSASGDPAALCAECFQESGDPARNADLTIYTLAGISPTEFPHRFLENPERTEPGSPVGRGTLNTLVGLIEK